MTDTVDSDRLAKLRDVAAAFETGAGPLDRDLFDAVVPDWQCVEYRSDGTGPGRYVLRHWSSGAVAIIDDPLSATDGALWLAGQTLSRQWSAPELTPTWLGQEARCEFWPHGGFGLAAIAESGSSLAIAICRAVVRERIASAARDGVVT